MKTVFVWHAYVAIGRREFDVADALRDLGADAFVPHAMVKIRRRGRYLLEQVPLVPKYVFAGFPIVPWTDLLDIKHLTGVVSIADEPARMTRRDLELARSMAEPPIAKIAPLRPGDRVRIKSGPFAECAALIEEITEGKAVLDIAKAGRVIIKRDELEAA